MQVFRSAANLGARLILHLCSKRSLQHFTRSGILLTLNRSSNDASIRTRRWHHGRLYARRDCTASLPVVSMHPPRREKRRLSRPWLGGRKSSSPQLDSRPNRLAQLVLVLLTGSALAYNQPSPVRTTKYHHASHPLPQSAHPRHHDRDNDHTNTHTRAGRLPPAGLRAPAHTAPSRHARPTHAKPCAPASPWLCPWQRRRVHRRAHPWSWWWPWRHACKSARVRTRNHPAPA